MLRVGGPGYEPTDQDILRTRVRSTGIVEHAFDVRGQKLRVLDVGGQRSERKKWCVFLLAVLAALLCVSVSRNIGADMVADARRKQDPLLRERQHAHLCRGHL